MKQYEFHAILEYGLGDYDDTPYVYEVTEEEWNLIQDALARKAYFDEEPTLEDLYHRLFQELYVKEQSRYLEKVHSYVDRELVEGDDYKPFGELSFYLTL